jgi:hypothetical protein
MGPLLCVTSSVLYEEPFLRKQNWLHWAVMDQMKVIDIFAAVKIWIAVFWVVTPFILFGDYKCFGGTYLQGENYPTNFV